MSESEQAAPWYMTRRAWRKSERMQATAKAIDEEMLWRFRGVPDASMPLVTYKFPRMDFGRVSWDMTRGKYQVRGWCYHMDDDDSSKEGFIVPASNLVLPAIPDDAVPIHIAHMLDVDCIEEIDDGFELFGGLKHDTEVYFIQGAFTGLIKIGIASNFDSRLASIQSGCSEPVVTLTRIRGNKHLESFFHGLFEPLRSHGEWFYPHWSIHSIVMGLDG